MDTARTIWVDKARGIGIILVVFGHSWRGLQSAGLSISPGLYRTVDATIYAFHMPFFFLVSGLFLERAIAKRDAPGYVADRVLRLLWPLMLWTWIFFAVKILAGNAPNTPHSLADFPILPFPPRLHFWFLWALFLIQVSLGLLAFAAGPLPRRTTFWVALFALSIAAVLWVDIPRTLEPWLIQALVNAPFVLLGVLITRLGHLPRRPVAGVLALIVFVGAIAGLVSADPPHGVKLGVTIIALLALVVLIHVAETASPGFARSRWLARLGRNSMAIYLGHTIFSAAMRSALLAVGDEQVWLHLLLGVGAGLAGPATLAWAANRFGLSRVLGF